MLNTVTRKNHNPHHNGQLCKDVVNFARRYIRKPILNCTCWIDAVHDYAGTLRWEEWDKYGVVSSTISLSTLYYWRVQVWVSRNFIEWNWLHAEHVTTNCDNLNQ
jgi:hypothetical protein